MLKILREGRAIDKRAPAHTSSTRCTTALEPAQHKAPATQAGAWFDTRSATYGNGTLPGQDALAAEDE